MRKSKSVLLLTTSFPLDSSSFAAGSFVFEKCRYLVKNGLQVKVIAPHARGAAKKEIIEGINIRRFQYFFPAKYQMLAYGAGIPTNLKNSFFARFQIPFFLCAFFWAALKEVKNCDVVHCHWSIAGLVGILAARFFNKKTVLMMHGAEVFVYGNNPLLRAILRNIDFLICNSTFTEEKTLAVYHPKNHMVIPPGIDINRFNSAENSTDIRKSLHISQTDLFILAIGNFIQRKGFEYLIEALNMIVRQKGLTHIKLGIGGKGPLRAKYEKMIENYALTDNVTLLGFIKDEEIVSYYTQADIFVLPSIVDERGDTEGLGVVLIEANACQTPVIGSSVGGIPDIIKDHFNGLLVAQKNPEDLAAKIMMLAENRKLRIQMGENGRKLVQENFNWDHIVKMIIRVYDSI